MGKRSEGVRVVHVNAVNLSLDFSGVFRKFGEEPPDADENGTGSITDVRVSRIYLLGPTGGAWGDETRNHRCGATVSPIT